VKTTAQRKEAMTLAKAVPNDTEVVNEIQRKPDTGSSLTKGPIAKSVGKRPYTDSPGGSVGLLPFAFGYGAK
jgi:hypothetical protein